MFWSRAGAVLMLGAFFGCGAPTGQPESMSIQPIGAEQLRSLVGEHRGDVLLINLWATWCSPCLKEIPDLMRLEDRYQDRGLRLLAIAMDDPAELETTVIPFRDRLFPEWKTYQRAEADMDTLVSVIDPAWNEILPTSYLLDRDGNLIRVIFGGKSYAEFEAAVLELL